MNTPLTPHAAMLMAIEEGRRGAGFVAPNPCVGCVVLDKDFKFLSRGYHTRVGQAHAEVEALKAVSTPSALEGAHIFVTLEPCAHEGRTPSCAKALAKLPIASVTYGLQDPNPLVRGQGAEILRQAGKVVTLFTELKSELEELCEIFLTNMRLQRPFVALKVATSLDGKIALSDGSSRWITGEAARAHTQFLRGVYSAVVVGAGTFLKDNPRLNSRDPRFADMKSKVVLLDPEGNCASRFAGSELLKVRAPEDVIWVTTKSMTSKMTHLQLPTTAGEFDLSRLLRELYQLGLTSLFLEGGAGVYSSFLRQGHVDRVYAFVAPKIIGEGLSWSSGFKLANLTQAPQLRNLRVENFADDVLLTGRLSPS